MRHSSATYTLNESIFEKCDTADKAYWIGFIMADGYIIQQPHKKQWFGMKLHPRDKYHLENLRDFVGSSAPIRLEKHKKYVYLYLCSNRFCRTLNKYGIVPRKSGKEQINHIPKRFLEDFIRGYMDGDGGFYWVKQGENRASQLGFCIFSSSVKLLHQIQRILSKLCGVREDVVLTDANGVLKMEYRGNKQARRIWDTLYYTNDALCLYRKYDKVVSGG